MVDRRWRASQWSSSMRLKSWRDERRMGSLQVGSDLLHLAHLRAECLDGWREDRRDAVQLRLEVLMLLLEYNFYACVYLTDKGLVGRDVGIHRTNFRLEVGEIFCEVCDGLCVHPLISFEAVYLVIDVLECMQPLRTFFRSSWV